MLNWNKILIEKDNPLRVFVVGCPRGGTTITQRLVAERFNLYTMPETRFFSNLIGNSEQRSFPRTARPRGWVGTKRSELREWLGLGTGREYHHVTDSPGRVGRRWAPIRGTSSQFVRALDEKAKRAGNEGWLEKSPSHVWYGPQILHLVPDAWMIHIVRDPQETIASIWDAARKYHDPWSLIYDRIERAVDIWNSATAASAAMVGRPRQIFLPYETLATSPDRTLELIADMLGLQGRPIASKSLENSITTEEEAWKAGAVNGAVAPAASKWQSALDDRERALVLSALQPVPDSLMEAMAPFRAVAAEAVETKVAGHG